MGPTARGEAKTLPHQERVWSRGTRGDTGALSSRVACPVPEMSGTGSGPGTDGTRSDTRALSCWVQSLALWD
jgi:hypothetical protein